jgi:transglutaminase/protease-like cytokinesis protein 3
MKTKNKKHYLLALILLSSLSTSSDAHAFDFSLAKKLLKTATDAVSNTITKASTSLDDYNQKKKLEEEERSNRRAEDDQYSNADAVENDRKKATEDVSNSTSDSMYPLTLNVPEDSRWVLVQITKGSFTSQVNFAVNGSHIEKSIPLKDCAGTYKLSIFANKTENRYTSYTYVKAQEVTNTDTRDLSYLLPSEHVQSTNAQIVELAKSITENAQNEREAVLLIHNYITGNISYDMEAFETGSYKTKVYDAISVLNSQSTFCSGYSNLFAALSRAVGIKARIINGKVDRNGEKLDHAWNQVFVDGEWKAVDTTWDTGRTDFKYFLPTEEKFAEDHTESKVMDIY